MRNRLLCLFLTLLLLPLHAFAAGEESGGYWSRAEGDGSYVTIRLPYPEGEGMIWSEYRNLSVRYADTKEPVALVSGYMQGYLFATVPARDAQRPLEVFSGQPLEFADCFVSWESEGKQESYYSPPLGADVLNVRGVIRGDEKGKLNPDAVISRAEAFAIVCRLLSLQPGGDPGFADVSPEDWYYEAASAAKAAGITNEPEYFRPGDQVTRGEITVMLARAMRALGWLGDDGGGDVQLADLRLIPDWAYDEYLAFLEQGIGIFTYQDTEERDEFGAPVQLALAEQDKGAARGEVVEMLYDALRFLPTYPTELAIQWGFDQGMPVIDGSTSTLPYTNAVYAALFSNYDNHPGYPGGHSKSYYSYERLISGEADLLFIAAKPTQDTIEKAAAAGVELEFIPIAYDAMVFFTNRENTAENLTMEQIRDIYVGNAYDSWAQVGGPDAGLIPYCRNADSGSQALMEEFFLEGGDVHPDIRRETTSMSMASVLTDVQDAMTEDPLAYALGYSIYYYYNSAKYLLLYPEDSLKLLSVDGVQPSDATIADGSYPLAGYNYIAIRAGQPEGSPARRMVEFMLSEGGQQCVSNAGYGALRGELAYDSDRDGVIQTSEFPVPTGEVFGLTGADARLYTVAAQAKAEAILPNVGREDTLLLLTYLNVFGQYDGEDGQLHYVCGYGEQYYYDLGAGLDDPANPVYSSLGGGGNPALITLTQDWELLDIRQTADGGDNTRLIRELCGPLTELADALNDGTAEPVRKLTPTGDELLRQYLNYYFPAS